MDNRPIGIFDSGLGGLTAVRELHSLLPREEIVYFGDTGRVPYGTRSPETIRKYAQQDIAFLLSKHVKMVLAACGTVSSLADTFRHTVPVPFTGVVEPASRAAAQATRNRRVGVIATTATIRSHCYRQTLQRLDPAIQVVEQDCPLFVPLVENGFLDPGDPIPYMTAQRYLRPLQESGIDTLILGCTHYPLLRPILADIMGAGVALIDSGQETASFTSMLLQQEGLLCGEERDGTCSFFVSDRVEGFSQAARLFLGGEADPRVQYVDLDSFGKEMTGCLEEIPCPKN